MRQLRRARGPITTALAAAMAAAALAAPAAVAADFSGKRIEVIVPFAPGGGSDVYIRAIAPHLQRHLPGQPSIIVRNVPGGGSIPGANQFEARAKPDGLHAIVASASTISNFVLKRSKVAFNLNRWEPVLLSPQGAVVYAATSLGIAKPEDITRLKGKPLTFGGESATSGELRTVLTLELIGFDTKYVWGLRRGPTRLAFERGELTVNYDSAPGYIKNATKLVKAGKAVPLYSMGIVNDKNVIVRDPSFPDLPSFPEAYERVHGKRPSGPGYDAWKAILQMGTMANKCLFLPEKTPEPIAAAWRKAVQAMLDDPKFQKEAEKIVGNYPQTVGAAARPIIKEATTFSPEVWDWLKAHLKSRHNVAL